ncbi:cupin domain-containing protein [Consotaella salsifontis]|uniref:Cupin domain protein n=1 Tax=Consotaella salsifontis TaxID=1365950 RepID=A0A1T4RXD7_9HYPH|nr:cupin domain-containing protein [Consotaella salsifontis]SKA20526.1 Cupin domain protein [Consotaella salsifontis]
MTIAVSYAPPKVGDIVHLLGTLITFKATAAETEGAFSLVEVKTGTGQGTPPHLQRDDAEAFYVLEGHYRFFLDGKTRVAGPGEFIYVPRGTPHGFWNDEDTPSRMLIINVPAGIHDRFFIEAGDPVESADAAPPMAPPDIPRLMTAAGRYGIEMLPQE